MTADTIGRGAGVAVLFNARARRVTPHVVRLFTQTLPDALVLVSEDLAQARRHVMHILGAKPDVVLVGGGDGSIVRMLNLLRELGAGAPFPAIGALKLGTGNAWARVTGSEPYESTVARLPQLARPLPTRRFDLVEVEGTLCHFAGSGWDAKLLNDYLRNLDKRSSQLIGSRIATRIHKGLPGYLYSLFRLTVPEEVGALLAHGKPKAVVENLGAPAYTLDAEGKPFLFGETSAPGVPPVLYRGEASIVAAGTTPEWGFGFRAFPFAQIKPGYINLRVYDRNAIEATRNMFKLWSGEYPRPGMHDFFVTHVRVHFSRPMPFHVAGDGEGWRERLEYRIADRTVQLVDWRIART